MPRVFKLKVAPPSRLSGILANLHKEPKPSLQGVKKLSLSYAAKNDHFGARHFVREDLPRIKWANPTVAVEVTPVRDQPWGSFTPTMVVERADGNTQTVELDNKWSSTILADLLDVAGDPSWPAWKAERKQAGKPIIENYGRKVIKKEFNPARARKQKEGTREPVSETVQADIQRAKSGTGAAAILPS